MAVPVHACAFLKVMFPLDMGLGFGLDIRGYHPVEHGFTIYARKADAERAALAAGWRKSDVTRASNRFWTGWVIGQQVGHDTFRLLGPDGPVDLKYAT